MQGSTGRGEPEGLSGLKIIDVAGTTMLEQEDIVEGGCFYVDAVNGVFEALQTNHNVWFRMVTLCRHCVFTFSLSPHNKS